MIQFDGSHIFQMGGEKPPTSIYIYVYVIYIYIIYLRGLFLTFPMSGVYVGLSKKNTLKKRNAPKKKQQEMINKKSRDLQ